MWMCLLGHRTYYCDWAAPKHARGFCTDQLTAALGHGAEAQEVIDDATAVVSELMTNAVQAGCSSIELDLEVHHDHLRMLVGDDVSGGPELRNPPVSEAHGRGLQIVDHIATAWGVAYPGAGKQVWAEIAVPPDLTTHLKCTV